MRDVYAPLPQPGKPLATTVAVLDSVKLIAPEIRYTRPSPQLDALLGIDLSGGATVGGKKPAAAGAGRRRRSPPRRSPVVAAKAETGPAAAAPLDLAIALLQMTNGEVEALDKTVKPVARTTIRNLGLEAHDVRFPATAASGIHLHATLPKTAQLDVRGDLKPGNVGDFTLELKQLELPVFNPYASAAAGVTVERGTASVKTKLKLRGAKMEIDNQLVLNKFGVSMRDPASFERNFGVPIDLALALLRDPQGDIRLHIPVKTDEKGATIAMGAVIASALKAALVGAITAPLKMLGAVFGGGDDGAGGFSIDPLPSVAGSPELDGDQQGRLDGLAQMLSERPTMGLALRGRVGPEDRPVVAQQILVERWTSGEGLPDVEEASFLARRRIGQALSRLAKGAACGPRARGSGALREVRRGRRGSRRALRRAREVARRAGAAVAGREGRRRDARRGGRTRGRGEARRRDRLQGELRARGECPPVGDFFSGSEPPARARSRSASCHTARCSASSASGSRSRRRRSTAPSDVRSLGERAFDAARRAPRAAPARTSARCRSARSAPR